jgi:hypothetical protein
LQWQVMAADPDLVLTGHRGRVISPRERDDHSTAQYGLDGSVRDVGSSRLLLFNMFITRSVMVRRDTPWRFEAGRYAKSCIEGTSC